MSKKTTNLQPWIDYFRMLQAYERQGLLLMKHDKHETYVTQAALHAMTDGDDPKEQIASGAILATAGHIRSYAAWLSREGDGYMKGNFAVNVISDSGNSDPLYTILMTRRSPWWCPWKEEDHVEVITY